MFRNMKMRLYKKISLVFVFLIILFICLILRSGFKIDEQELKMSEHNSQLKTKSEETNVAKEAVDRNNPVQSQHHTVNRDSAAADLAAKCNINGEQTIKCMKNDNEIYIPFNFVKQYFEIYGDVKENTLFWQHSNARVVMLDKEGYKTDGVFMSFDHYNVEGRERVFCLTGAEGVPYSTQWARKPYPYTIQIAQFGLSHYSKMLRESKGKTGGRQTPGMDKSDWDISDDCDFSIDDGTVITYSCPPRSSVQLPLNEVPVKLATMSIDAYLTKGSSVSLVAELPGRKEVQVVYLPGNSLLNVSRDKKVLKYYIGSPKKWVQLIRMPKIDIRKAFASTATGKKARKRKKRVMGHRRRNNSEQSDGAHLRIRSYRRIVLRGSGKIRRLTFTNTNHKGMFLQAAEWLLHHQSVDGGWPVPVRRRFGSSNLQPLPPGWLSAMAQGHAMSLLSRAYALTRNSSYLNAALKGTKPFEIMVKDGGVRTLFANKYVWYEEYPTTPSLFVLNGFIYSLIGLYDVSEIADSSAGALASKLFKEGLQSLNYMLPLFDTGSGTFYDLRHVTLRTTPNRARWDYHSTHITQLLLLGSIDKNNPLWLETAARWLSYTRGERAPHN